MTKDPSQHFVELLVNASESDKTEEMKYSKDKEKHVHFREDEATFLKLVKHAEEKGLKDVSKLMRVIVREWLARQEAIKHATDDIFK